MVPGDCAHLPPWRGASYPFQFVGAVASGSGYGESDWNGTVCDRVLPGWNHGVYSRGQFCGEWDC